MVKLLLIRHGQTQWNLQRKIQGWKDSVLTQHGVAELKSMAIPPLNRPRLVSSDLGRAYHSATIIAERMNTPVVVDARLKERRFGELEGNVIDRDPLLHAYWLSYHQRYQRKITTIPGVEPEWAFEQRIRDFLSEIIDEGCGSDLIIISHGEWIRAFLNIIYGVPSWRCGQGVDGNATLTVLDGSLIVTAQGSEQRNNEKVC